MSDIQGVIPSDVGLVSRCRPYKHPFLEISLGVTQDLGHIRLGAHRDDPDVSGSVVDRCTNLRQDMREVGSHFNFSPSFL